MSFPPLRPPSESPAVNESKSARPQPPRPSAWSLPSVASGSSRPPRLPQLATGSSGALADAAGARPGSSGPAAVGSPATTGPPAPSFSAVLNAGARPGGSSSAGGGRAAPSAAAPLSATSFPSLQQAGAPPQLGAPASLLASPRSSHVSAPFPPGSSLASSAAPAGGGGSSTIGGGPARTNTFSPAASATAVTSPTSSASERANPFAGDRGRSGITSSNQSSVDKIVVTQVFLLLGSITEKEGKTKWDLQAENIRKLVYNNGMEVFAKYFKRLLVGNSPQIFPGISRNVENAGNYQLLVQEVDKAASDPQQAEKIAEIIDTGEGDIFRDFDLATFLNHFKLDAVPQTILASAFTRVGKADLRSKAAAILSSNFHALLQIFAGVENSEQNHSPAILASAAYLILRDVPNDVRDGSEKETVKYAFETRYAKANIPVPPAIRSAIVLVTMLERDGELARDIENQGPAVTASVENARDFLRRYNRNQLDAGQICIALLMMIMTPNGEQYQPSVFVQALRDHGISGARWIEVVRGFDREGLVIEPPHFLTLYRALEPIALDDSSFDIQQLWGGPWTNKATQLSFAVAFASLTPAQLNAEDIPSLRMAYDPREWDDVPEECAHLVKEAVQDPMISIEAVTAIIEGLWDPKDATAQAITEAKQVVAEKITFFLASAGAIEKPWVESQQSLMNRIFVGCLSRQQNDYQWILHCLWKEDKAYVAARLMDLHAQDPLQLEQMLEHATEHGWVNDLLTMLNGFGIDLAALAHRKGLRDLREWAEPKLQQTPGDVAQGLARFLVIKAQDELRVAREEQASARTEMLAMKTVYAMLEIIEEQMKDSKHELLPLKRQCMQAFPRLCNYGEGFDETIELNGADGNKLPPTADAEMQELYKKMYNSEIEVRHVIEVLRDCKTSDEPQRQDVFACMIHGLFDEYVCFNEYPLAPLATTAVLFGGIINYGILSRFTLDVAVEMVLEAVRDYPPDSSMYKFGLQALMHFKGRLREWRDVAQSLVQIHGLQGTPIYGPAQDALREGGASPPPDNASLERQTNGKQVNGNMDEFLSNDSLVPQFRSVNPDLPIHLEQYEDPDESVQDKVLFMLNNVTEQNLDSKIHDLADALQPKHFPWFAAYLVEQRAKSQPNYQTLYLDLLGLLADRGLWTDVLRETYVSVRRVLNSEATTKSAPDRVHLKNLGTWLGLLTIARDKPIKHKNIAFKELLIEGWETQRLLLVIPFTCEVLAQGAKSVVFRPPNPWVMEIIGLLLELYDLPDLKIQQKFAVEVLLGTFGLPRNGEGLERSGELKKRQQRYEAEMGESVMADGMEGFDDMAIGNLNRGLRNTRLSPTDIAATLPDMSTTLVFPPASSSPINHTRLRQIIQTAVQRSIMEIIGPVVERSVTIATIATKDLVTKDYAQEPDEEHVREAFETMAKTTAGSLAAVTCKEPLRMSITNFIRNAGAEVPNEAIPEGLILMCVNDNIEIACKIVQDQAEQRALPEIKPHIDAEIQKRQQHKNNFPNELYRDPIYSPWAAYMPEPYKQMPGGLNQQQLDIYANFAPQTRAVTAHTQTASTDSGKQIPDVLQETGFPSVPSLSTPAELPALPHQPQPQLPPSNVPLQLANSRAPSQVNGYMDGASVQDHIENAISELSRVSHSHLDPGQKLKELPRDSPVGAVLSRVLNLVRSSQDPDGQAFWVAGVLHRMLYNDAESNSKFETAVLVALLKQICLISPSTHAKLHSVLQKSGDEQILNVPITAALLEAELLEYSQVDAVFARLIGEHQSHALDAFEKLLDSVLFSGDPIALRGDFVHSFGVMGEWFATAPELETAAQIASKLKRTGIPELAEPPADQHSREKQEQLAYTLNEWLAVFAHPNRAESLAAAFMVQLQKQGFGEDHAELMQFFKLGFEAACDSFERITILNQSVDLNEAHFDVDALARFVVMLVKTRSTSDAKEKSEYLKSVLFLVVLILNNHQVMRGESFNQHTFFRFFSTVLYDWHELIRGADAADDQRTILAFADTLLLLDPNVFAAFGFAWLALTSHRVFMPAVLKDAGTEGLEAYARIMEVMLSYVSKMLKSHQRASVGKELYFGALRLILILHHDFPEFVAENHYRLCDVIPSRCTQLRNLVLSAFPSSIYELPDPFGSGLKVDRLDDMRKPPVLAGDPFRPLAAAGLTATVDALLAGPVAPAAVAPLLDALATAQAATPSGHGSALGQALVLYVGHRALAPRGGTAPQPAAFVADSPAAQLLTYLTQAAPAAIRYHLLGALANQLRYPNSHTHYFSAALLHLFGAGAATSPGGAGADDAADARPQIVRVLLERLIVHRPHPWGLIITLLELLKNSAYAFWELPFIKAAPEVATIIQRLVDLGRSASLDEQSRGLQR